jgi:hypothetical protein
VCAVKVQSHGSARIAFVAAHLTDTTVWDAPDRRALNNGAYPDRGFQPSEVRNYTAATLTRVLGFGDRPRHDWTAAQWAQLRERVRQALEHDARR